MDRTYHLFRYRLDARTRYLIWFTNDDDGVVVDSRGLVPCFADEPHARAYAQDTGVALAGDVYGDGYRILNLDILVHWLRLSLSAPCRAKHS